MAENEAITAVRVSQNSKVASWTSTQWAETITLHQTYHLTHSYSSAENGISGFRWNAEVVLPDFKIVFMLREIAEFWIQTRQRCDSKPVAQHCCCIIFTIILLNSRPGVDKTSQSFLAMKAQHGWNSQCQHCSQSHSHSCHSSSHSANGFMLQR